MYDAAAAVNAANLLKMQGRKFDVNQKIESGTSSSEGNASGPKNSSGT